MKKRTVAQTPAPAKDIIKGSSINKKLSATKEGASTIELSERTIKVLQDKLKAFKEKHPNNTTVTLNDLKAVYRRGSGAYSTSHRPNITRAGWSYARVNKFLEKAGGNKVKEAYIQDDDLLKYMKGGKVLNKADKMGKQIICKNCGWKWNTDKSDDHNKYICNKCNFDNRTFYDSEPIGYANGGLIAPNGKPSNLTPEQYKLVRTPAFKRWFGDWENDLKNSSKVVDENGEPLILYHGTKAKFNIFKINSTKPYSFFAQNKEYANEYTKDNYIVGKPKIYECFLNIRTLFNGSGWKFWNFSPIIDRYIIEQIEKDKKSGIINSKEIDSKIRNSLKEFIESQHKNGVSILWFIFRCDGMGYTDFLKQYNKDFSNKNKNKKREWLKNFLEGFGYNGFVQYENINGEKVKNYDIDTKKNPFYASKVYAVFYPNQIKLADGTNTTFDENNPDIRYEQGGKLKTYWYKGLFCD